MIMIVIIIIAANILIKKIFFNFMATLHGMWDLGSLTRDRTHTPCIGSAES